MDSIYEENSEVFDFARFIRPGSKTVAFLRTSKGASLVTLQNQWESIRSFCMAKDVALNQVYTFMGSEGEATDYINQIASAMKSNSCNTLIVASISRLGRRMENVEAELASLRSNGIRVVSLQEGDITNFMLPGIIQGARDALAEIDRDIDADYDENEDLDNLEDEDFDLGLV